MSSSLSCAPGFTSQDRAAPNAAPHQPPLQLMPPDQQPQQLQQQHANGHHGEEQAARANGVYQGGHAVKTSGSQQSVPELLRRLQTYINIVDIHGARMRHGMIQEYMQEAGAALEELKEGLGYSSNVKVE